MKKSKKVVPDIRQRAVHLAQEPRCGYLTLCAADQSIAPKVGCVPQTLPGWVKRQQVDSGVRAGSRL